MDRYIVVSSDGHAGPPAELYRDYLDPEFRDRFDEHQETMTAFRASMETESSKRFVEEWEEETGGDGGLTAGYDSAARNADPRHRGRRAPRCCSPTPTCSAPAGSPRRRSAPGWPPARRAIPPTPSPGAAPTTAGSPTSCSEEPHRRIGIAVIPAIIPDMDLVLAARARGQGPRATAASSSRPAGSTGPPTTSPHYDPLLALTEELGLVLHTHSGAGPADYGMGYGHAPDLRERGRLVGGPPAARAHLGGRVRAAPRPQVLDGRERRLVGARRDPQDGREVGRRAQHPQVRRRVPRRRCR